VFREVASSAALGTVLFAFVLFLRQTGKYFEVLLRGSATPAQAMQLFLMVVPPVLSFAIPIGTLVGVLLALGRMSSDGEITAMRATGWPARRLLGPIGAFAVVAMSAALAASLWITPWSMRETARLVNSLIARQLTAEVRPRVFEEQFSGTNTVLYVGDVVALPGTTARWRNVFIADSSPAEQRKVCGEHPGDAPAITVATEALAVPNPGRNTIQLSMSGVSCHQVGSETGIYYNTYSPHSEQLLQARAREETQVKTYLAMDTRPLLAEAASSRAALIELHQRLALPAACLVLALLGAALGVSTRKGGKSAATVLTVALAFFYYMMLVSLIGLAEEGKLPVAVAIWTPNAVFLAAALVLIRRMEHPGDHDWLGRLNAHIGASFSGLLARLSFRSARQRGGLAAHRLLGRLSLGVLDGYVLSTFFFYFSVFLASFVLMAHVFIFFELLSDAMRRGIPFPELATYHLFLTPKLVYDSAPHAVLVGVLVSLGVLAKSNEVTAMKACGVSVYRLAAPLLAAGLAMSGVLFAFDHYYIPEANLIQDSILNKIKGRPIQTLRRPDPWIHGEGSRIFHYKYFDEAGARMAQVNLYELDPRSYRLRRHISAESARWEPSLNEWIFQNGWWRDLNGARVTGYEEFQARTFPELTEDPGYFLKEVRQEKQMNFVALDRYIGDLQQSGVDTTKLRVQYHKKFSQPMFVWIIALLAVPFALAMGRSGAMTGIGVAIGITITYLVASRVFEEVGNLATLPPAAAAWAPDALFGLAGFYLFTRMRS
jgi:LPS export ABC transporter permease LptG/LPS export ABC transporter permease LptF